MGKRKFRVVTEWGTRIVESNQDLKTYILYLFNDGPEKSPQYPKIEGKRPSNFWYHSITTKANTRKNFPYLRRLFSQKETDTGFGYNANSIRLYPLEEVLD